MTVEKEIFLNVKPFCNEPQLIHMESVAGCNIAFTGTFKCINNNDENTLKLKGIKFNMYPMFGLFTFGFDKIEVKRSPNNEGLRVIDFQLELGSEEYTKEITFDEGNEIIWNFNDTIDNNIVFKVGPIIIEREGLNDIFKKSNLYKNFKDFEANVPTIDRPCKFKLVSEI